MNLARTRFLHADGSELKPEEIKDVKRDLDLWTGVHTTTFTLDGTPVKVATCISDDVDLDSTVGIKIDSELVQSGKLVVEITFPYPSLLRDAWTGDFSENAVKTPFTIKEPTCAPSVSALCVKRELKNEYARGVVGDFPTASALQRRAGSWNKSAKRLDFLLRGLEKKGRSKLQSCSTAAIIRRNYATIRRSTLNISTMRRSKRIRKRAGEHSGVPEGRSTSRKARTNAGLNSNEGLFFLSF